MKLAEKNRKVNRSSSLHNSNAGQTPFFQPKLEVGQPGDQFEQEADSMADKVVGQINGSSAPFFSPASNQMLSLNNQLVQNSEFDVPQLEDQYDVLGEADPYIQKTEIDSTDVFGSSPPSVQTKTEDQPELKPEEELLNDEDVTVQAQSDKIQEIPSDFESGLNSSRGSGSLLPDSTKSQMETGFGTDFSNVRIHTDSNAIQMSRQIGAQAFTHGNNIYFNKGKYNPSTTSGQHLLAHELTHTVQQAGGVQREMVQRQEVENEDSSKPKLLSQIDPSTDGRMEKTGEKIKMILTGFKVKDNVNESDFNFPLKLPQSIERNTKQISVWKKNVKPLVRNQLDVLIKEIDTDSNKYTLKIKGNENVSMSGTKAQLANELFVPYWDYAGEVTTYQVEHLIDWQLAGGGNNNVDNINNLILLDAPTNNELGQQMLQSKKTHIERVLNHYKEAGVTQNVAAAMNTYEITIHSINKSIPVKGSQYKKSDFESSSQKNPIRNQLTDIKRFELPEGNFLLKTSKRGISYSLPYNADGYEAGSFVVTATSDADNHALTSIILDPKVAENSINNKESSVYSVEELGTDEFLASGLKSRLRNFFELKLLSPIVLDEEQIEIMSGMNIYAVGNIVPSIPILSNANIDIVIEGRAIRLRKLFNTGEISLPSPFVISDSCLEAFVGSSGVGVQGSIDFGIDHVGEGYIGASESVSAGFELEGVFNFDSELFDPAEVRVQYKENAWTIGGTIGIPQRKIQGIKSATINVDYTENTLTADGEAELDIPGIDKGIMEVVYGEDGFSMSGEFNLNDDIPGISSGRVTASVVKTSGEEGYSVSVTGSAIPAIKGIASELAVNYESGALIISGRAAYNRGMLSGEINIGVTNRSIDENGAPSGEPDKTLRVYGGGRLTLRLTPWLQAIAGVQFLPHGEIEVVGEIGIPNTVDIFGRKSFDKNLFNAPTIEIPIFAIPLGPRSLGVVAQISGGLDFSAGFGPGQLRELSVGIRYNPDREEETVITGRGLFAIPADAGLTLRGNLGLGVSIAVASLTGGIELAGTLGLEGEASAAVDVNWSPQSGLSLDAEGRVMVNPKFTFDINAYARASLDLLITTISETWRYNLASFSWGPDIQFGIVFPVHYREGEPFDLSFDDIEVVYPDLDIIGMARNLGVSIKNRLFD